MEHMKVPLVVFLIILAISVKKEMTRSSVKVTGSSIVR